MVANNKALIEAGRILHFLPVTSNEQFDIAFFELSQQAADVFYEGIKLLEFKAPKLRKRLHHHLADIAPFYTDTPYPLLTRKIQVIASRVNRLGAKVAFLDSLKGDLTGKQLTNRDSTQGLLFLPDASEQGRFRFSRFDVRGFYGHTTRDTYAELLELAWEDGFNTITEGLLESWCILPEWRSGSDSTLDIQQVNLGKMTFESYVNRRHIAVFGARLAELSDSIKGTHSDELTLDERVELLTLASQEILPFQLSRDAAKHILQNGNRNIPDTILLKEETPEASDTPALTK